MEYKTVKQLLNNWYYQVIGRPSSDITTIRLFYNSEKFGLHCYYIGWVDNFLSFETDHGKNRNLDDVLNNEIRDDDTIIVQCFNDNKLKSQFKTSKDKIYELYNMSQFNYKTIENFKRKLYKRLTDVKFTD
jgi:hypothetical protein